MKNANGIYYHQFFLSGVWCVKEGRTIIKTIDSNVNGSLFLCPHEREKMWKDSCVHDGMRRMTTKGKIIDTHCQRDIWRIAIRSIGNSTLRPKGEI